MPIIEWNKKYLIGDKQIDLHHQYLFSLLNKTYDNFVRSVGADDLNQVFDEFVDYVTYYFSAEEELMQKIQFPGFEMHKKEHDMFAQKVVEMHNEYLEGGRSLNLEVLSFLHDWISTHILMSDAEMGRFLAAEKRDTFQGSRKNEITI